MTDSGIASSTRSPTISEKKSALSLKFGFHSRVKTVERINSLNVSNKNSAAPAKKQLVYSGGSIPAVVAAGINRIQQPTLPIRASCKISTQLQLVKSRTISAQQQLIKNRAISTQQQLNVIKSRAAVVLNRVNTSSSDYRSLTMRPRLSVEAIVASLEREIRDQLGPDLPPLPPPDLDAKDAKDARDARDARDAKDVRDATMMTTPSIIDVERFGIDPIEAEVAYVESPVDDCIDNIESLVTPSSICTTYNSQLSPIIDGDCNSRDDCHQADEEDSAATSISDAMIDDEIADQPGLVILGQSASVPASPMHSWRSDLFQYAPATMNLMYQQSEDDRSDSCSYPLLRRRVASVNDINGGVKDSATEAMRGDLYSNWEDSVIIDIDEYNSMANELANIKSQLIQLQDLLVEAVDSKEGSSPLWDLKRDLVLLREELQEKNVTIRSLKNELLATTGRIQPNSPQSTTSSTSCHNVATQTDRPRGTPLSNGVSPSPDDIQLVSSKLKAPSSGLPVRSRPLPLATN